MPKNQTNISLINGGQREDLSRYPIEKRTSTSTHFRVSRNKYTALFTLHPHNRYDTAGWKPITDNLEPDQTGKIKNDRLDFSISASGVVTVGQHSHRLMSIGGWDGTYRPIRTPGSRRIDGNKLIYDTSMGDFIIEACPTLIKERLILPEYPAQLSDNFLALATVMNDARLKPTDDFGDPLFSDIGYPPAMAYDKHRVNAIYLRRRLVQDGNNLILFTLIPTRYLERAKYPVTIDPSVEITGHSNDIAMYGTGDPFSSARSSYDSCSDSDTEQALGMGWSPDNVPPRFFVRRLGVLFDTSSLAASLVLYDIRLELTVESEYFAGNYRQFDVKITKSSWTGCNESSWDSLMQSTVDGTWKSTSSVSAGNSYESDANLDSDHINRSGYTRYGLVSQYDISNSAPDDTVEERELITLYLANAGVASRRPVLKISYYGGSPQIIMPI